MFEHLSLSKYTDYITKMCFSMLSFFQIIYMLKTKVMFYPKAWIVLQGNNRTKKTRGAKTVFSSRKN